MRRGARPTCLLAGTWLVASWIASGCGDTPDAGPVADAATDGDASSPDPMEVVVDNTSPGFTASPAWFTSTSVAGYYGSDYHARATGTAEDPAAYALPLSADGRYRVHARWTSGGNRSTVAPYEIDHAGGTSVVAFDQRQNNGTWAQLGVFDFARGDAVRVRLSADAPAGAYVIADAVRFQATSSRWSGWTEATSEFSLPAGVRVYRWADAAIPLRITAVDVDLGAGTTRLRSFLSTSRQLVTSWQTSTGALVAINAGYFDLGTGASYSAIVDSASLLSRTLGSVTRSGVSYPLTRGFFSVTSSGALAVDWIFHAGPDLADVYRLDQPAGNAMGAPASAPQTSDGAPLAGLDVGVGAGPVLVKDGVPRVTWTEEVFWDSGVGRTDRAPRSGVCYTADRHVVLLAADGRQASYSVGIDLDGLAAVMLDVGCVEGLNLDGGGSTGIAIAGGYVNQPSEMRAVTSVLAVVAN